MKSEDVILQLYSKLPQQTNRFTVSVVLNTVTSVATVATATTATAHGLAVNDIVNINGISTPLVVFSLTRVGGVLEVETSDNHDLTLGFQTEVTIAGANESEFNGTFTLLSVPNRKNFTLQTIDSGATTGTGSILALNISSIRYTGLYNVASVPTITTFTYELAGSITSDSFGVGIASVGFRISGAATLQRAIDSYTKQTAKEDWLFVVLGNVAASKDRNINSDAIAIQNSGTAWKQQLIQPFTIYGFSDSTSELSARAIRDSYEDVATFLFKSVVGAKFETGLAETSYYKTVFDTHGTQEYNSAVYIHTFNFQTVTDLTEADVVDISEESVAFRDISLTIANNLMTVDSERLTVIPIDLDQEAL